MTEEQLIDLIRFTLFVSMEISAPILLTTLVIGLGVSIFQSVTQITETTLIFIPKLLCFVVTFAITLPWIMKIMIRYTYDIVVTHWNSIMSGAINVM